MRTIEISGPGSNRGPGQRSQELNYEQYEEHTLHTLFVDMRPSTLYVVHSSIEKLYEKHCIVEEKSKGWLNVIALYVPRPHCSTFETFDWVDSTFLPFHLGYWYSGLPFEENIFSVIITNITITIIKCSIIVWQPTATNFIKYGETLSSGRPVTDLFPPNNCLAKWFALWNMVSAIFFH